MFGIQRPRSAWWLRETLVVIAAPGFAEFEGHESGTSVRMGARIGVLQREYEST